MLLPHAQHSARPSPKVTAGAPSVAVGDGYVGRTTASCASVCVWGEKSVACSLISCALKEDLTQTENQTETQKTTTATATKHNTNHTETDRHTDTQTNNNRQRHTIKNTKKKRNSSFFFLLSRRPRKQNEKKIDLSCMGLLKGGVQKPHPQQTYTPHTMHEHTRAQIHTTHSSHKPEQKRQRRFCFNAQRKKLKETREETFCVHAASPERTVRDATTTRSSGSTLPGGFMRAERRTLPPAHALRAHTTRAWRKIIEKKKTKKGKKEVLFFTRFFVDIDMCV